MPQSSAEKAAKIIQGEKTVLKAGRLTFPTKSQFIQPYKKLERSLDLKDPGHLERML